MHVLCQIPGLCMKLLSQITFESHILFHICFTHSFKLNFANSLDFEFGFPINPHCVASVEMITLKSMVLAVATAKRYSFLLESLLEASKHAALDRWRQVTEK